MEQRVQKALNFLKNPKTSSMTLEKKLEFLKSKLTPVEYQEVVKRSNESQDFNKFFEPASVPEQQTHSKWNMKAVTAVGAVILGSIATAFYSNRSSKQDLNPMQQEILTITQQKLDAQAEIIENLNKRVSELQFNYELLKRENDEKRAFMMKSEEIKVESEEVKEEEVNEELFSTFDKFFEGISDMNKGLALKTLKMWLTNIASNPTDKQKSKINTTNPQYKNYFAGVPEVDKLFTIMGFTLKGSILEFENPSLVQVNAVINKVTETISSLPSQPFSSSSPWLMKPMPRKDVPEEPKSAPASVPEESLEPHTIK